MQKPKEAAKGKVLQESIHPELAEILKEWKVPREQAVLSVLIAEQRFPLAHIDMLRQLLEQGWVGDDTPVLHIKSSRWYEASQFPEIDDPLDSTMADYLIPLDEDDEKTDLLPLSEEDMFEEDTDIKRQALPDLQFEDTSHEIYRDNRALVAKKGTSSVESSIENALNSLFSSPVVPQVSSDLFDGLTFSHTVKKVDWKELKRLYTKAGEIGRTSQELERSFSRSQHVCFLYFDVELIGAVRALSDHTCSAMICDLVISPRLPQKLICSALVGALLEEIKAKQVFLVGGASVTNNLRYGSDSLHSLGFEKQQGVLLRVEEED